MKLKYILELNCSKLYLVYYQWLFDIMQKASGEEVIHRKTKTLG